MNGLMKTAAGIAAANSVLLASADFVSPTSWDRGLDGATYQHWDVFDSASSDDTPDVGNVNPNGQAVLTDTFGGASLLGSGNLYTPGGAAAFSVTVPEADIAAPPHDATVIVQIKTQGTELDAASVLVNGLSPVDSAELSRVALGGFGGEAVETWYLFNVPYASFADGDGLADELIVTFAASGAHMSLDQVAVDTAVRPFGFYAEPNPVPEPGSVALLGAAGLLMVSRRRRGVAC